MYLDHAATTPIDPRVHEVMLPFLGSEYGNPSSFHMKGKVVRDAIDAARSQVANAIGSRPDEIFFTSGGTESDNLAILGAARKHAEKGKHIVSTKTEHQAVLEALYHLEKKEGFEVTYVECDKYGRVSAEDVVAALRDDTILVSIIFGNNEIGTLNPIQEIGNALRKWGEERGSRPLFHSDACQVLGDRVIDVDALHVDLLTINSSKIYGPKGVGALFVKRGTKLQPLQFGGSQELARRPGTENVPGIIAFGKAAEIAAEEADVYRKQLAPLRDWFIEEIQKRIHKTRLNGHPSERLANNVNISFMDIEGEALLLYLDASGIYAATGSACTSASLDPSHVILALGLPYEVAHGSIRFSLGRDTTKEDLEYVLEKLPPLVEKLRAISPVNVDPKYYDL